MRRPPLTQNLASPSAGSPGPPLSPSAWPTAGFFLRQGITPCAPSWVALSWPAVGYRQWPLPPPEGLPLPHIALPRHEWPTHWKKDAGKRPKAGEGGLQSDENGGAHHNGLLQELVMPPGALQVHGSQKYLPWSYYFATALKPGDRAARACKLAPSYPVFKGVGGKRGQRGSGVYAVTHRIWTPGRQPPQDERALQMGDRKLIDR